MHNSDLAVVVEPLDSAHRLVPAELRVDLKHVRLFDADRGPVLIVEPVAVGNDGVQAIVAAEPFEDNQDFAALLRGNAVDCLGEHWRHAADAAGQAETDPASAKAQHVATGKAGFGQWILFGHEALPPRWK